MLQAVAAGVAWAEGWARAFRKVCAAVHQSVGVLEDLLGEKLVNRTGEGLGYDRLTEAGERFWRLTDEFVREFWA